MFGIGGGFLITPLLFFAGIPPAVAVATSPNQIVASSFSALLGHLRRRTVDIAMEIAVLVAAVVRTQKLRHAGAPNASEATALADLHARNAQRYINGRFRALWANDDDAKYRLGRSVLDGHHAWLEDTSRAPSESAQPTGSDQLVAK